MSNEKQGGVDRAPDLEAELAREREARVQMRDRLRNTEALAAEAQALRARMAHELERVTAERDRLRAQSVAAATTATPPAGNETTPPRTGAEPAARAASAPPPRAATSAAAAAARPAGTALPHRAAEPARSTPPAAARGPWRSLGLLAGVAACAGAVAWLTGTMPATGPATTTTATAAPAAAVASTAVVAAGNDAMSASATEALDRAASAVAASRRAEPEDHASLAMPLPPASSPEALIALAPTAAAPASAASPELAARLRKALDAEGIAAPVEVEPQNGHVAVSDPAADNATRDRTDMLIRAVYAGASLPEPQIEHRWVSAPRAGRVASAPTVPPKVVDTHVRATQAAADDARRHRAGEARTTATVATAGDLPVILPMGRITAACKDATGTSTSSHPRAGALTACMRRSCCSSPNRQTEECRAYEHAYPFTCSAG